MKRKKKPIGKIRRTIDNILFLGLSFMAFNQTYNAANNLYHMNNPSEIRQEFNEKHGITLEGWVEDVEWNRRNVSLISEAISREKRVGDFDLDTIEIIGDNVLKMDPVDQFSELFLFPINGYYFFNNVSLNNEVDRDVLVHEIKHDKTFEILKEHPEFLEKWKALSTDIEGNSLYEGAWEFIWNSFKWFRPSEDKINGPENLRLGFINYYARRNVYEDIAELSGLVDSSADVMATHYFQNPKIRAKIDLGIEYGLIPEDTVEYFELSALSSIGLRSKGLEREGIIEDFLLESERFLKDNFGSFYEPLIRLKRAEALSANTYLEQDSEKIRQEYLRILNMEYKAPEAYKKSLEELAKLYAMKSLDQTVPSVFQEALLEYNRRYDSGDLELITEGVNDYLEERGIDLGNE